MFVVDAISVHSGEPLIRVAFTGILDESTLGNLSVQLRMIPAFKAGCSVICDLTAVTSVRLTGLDISRFGRAARNDKNRIAIVAPNSVAFGLARMYEAFADDGGERIHVCSNAVTALRWITNYDAAWLDNQRRLP
jgi:hypothetical protein